VILYRWLIAFLVWLSADPQTIDLERPKAAAAVAAARSSMAVEAAPVPTPPARSRSRRLLPFALSAKARGTSRCPMDTRCSAHSARARARVARTASARSQRVDDTYRLIHGNTSPPLEP
jgi:hypothetical protein